MQLDLNAMMLFAKVVEAQSYSQAARDAGIPKSTISRKISQMEESLGVRLLQRNSRQLRLTQVGREVYDNCVNILREVQSVHATIENAREEVTGSLKVVLPIAFNQEVMAALCSGFLKLHPKVDLEVQFSDGEIDLIGQNCDIAVMFGPLASSDLVARLLFERSLVLVASPSYIRAQGEPRCVEDLKDHYGLMLGSSRSAPIWPLGSGADKRLVSFRPRAWANSSAAIKQMAKDGLGIALMTRTQCRGEIQSGELQPLLPDLPIEPIKAYGLYSSRYQLAPKISRFLDYFAKHIDKQEMSYPLQLSPLRAVPSKA
ncbi:LysR family transcriptional regulator [Gilvimarinus sp. F26214L]|uniref:LysR family transcriptional regulator n=1 Tax=Gilvimarinus sp. DZF01 TaxID=3461371 RepID=UPI0040456DFA